MNAMSNNIRHAVSKQTGATTLAFRTGRGQWEVRCLSHSTKTTVANRGEAWTTSSHPATFCAKCKTIAAGKGKRIEGKRLAMPTIKTATPTTKGTATTKPAAKAAKASPTAKTSEAKATKSVAPQRAKSHDGQTVPVVRREQR